MSTKLKIIIALLFLVQGAVFYWSYSDKETVREIELLPYRVYLKNPLAVKSMDLSNQSLDKIVVDFSLFPNLEYLDLSNNSLEEIPDEILELPKLKTLLINNNELYLAKATKITKNNSIEKLDLKGNYLDDGFNLTCLNCFENLKYLDLSFNNLNEIPDLSATKLDTILITNNRLGNNPNIAAYLPKNNLIKYLDLSNNKNTFSEEFEYSLIMLSIKCRSINLSDNSFSSFPYKMFEHKVANQLKSVNFSNCNFDRSLKTLAENNIDTLNFSGNPMYLGDNIFAACKNLKYLDISGSKVHNFDSMNLTLKYLSIDIKEEVSLFLPNLEILSVEGDLGIDLDIYGRIDVIPQLLKNATLPKLKTIIIKNYKKDGLKELLKINFPNVKIVIESYKDNIEIDEETRQEFEEKLIKFIETENIKNN